MKKETADKTVFKHSPKSFRVATSEIAKDFVSLQADKSSDFQISEVVAQQAGVTALRKKNVEAQVEETVLERLKEIEEQAYRQAYDLGLIEGKETAFQEAKSDFSNRLVELDSLLAEIHSIKTQILKESESALIKNP
jgi:flagellar assembly protein FliH